MSRSFAAVLPLALLLVLSGTGSVGAQAPANFEDRLYESRSVAQARFAADAAAVDELARARLTTDGDALRGRFQEFLAGRGTQLNLFDACDRVLVAGRAVRGEAGAAETVEVAWGMACEVHAIDEARYEAGRVSIADLSEAAEYRWEILEIRARTPRAGSVTGAAGFFRFPTQYDALDGFQGQAKRNFEVESTTAVAAALRRRESGQDRDRARMQEFLAGRGTLDAVLWGAVWRWLRSESVRRGEGDALAGLDQRWRQAWILETITRARSEAGRMPLASHLEARCDRLEIQATLSAARRANPGGRPGIPVDLFPVGDDEVRDLARARFEVDEGAPADALRVRSETARTKSAFLFRAYERDPRTFGAYLNSRQELLQTERDWRGAAVDGRVLEGLWRLAWLDEAVTAAAFEQGLANIGDLAEARGRRLDVELELAHRKEPLRPR